MADARPDSRDLHARWVAASVRRALFAGDARLPSVHHYEIRGYLGAGGAGQVFAAYDLRLRREVALKWLPDGTSESALTEARSAAQVRHPNVVQVYDAGRSRDGAFIVMELMEGGSLQHWLESPSARAAGARRRAYAWLHAVTEGLACAHAEGLHHGDLKPANLLLDRSGRVAIADFGLSRLGLGTAHAGTPAYMAPEQLRGERADASTDRFALCVTVFEVLCGRLPYRASDLRRYAETGEPPPPLEFPRHVPHGLRRALRAGLSVEPRERPSDLGALRAALRVALRPATGRWVLVGIGVVVLAVVPGVLASTRGVSEAPPAVVADLPADAPVVLWIDDHPEHNRDEELELAGAGIRVHAVTTSAEALALDLHDYAAVVTDVGRFEDGTWIEDAGIELARTLHTRYPDLPVYAYTTPPRAAAVAATGVVANATGDPRDLLRWLASAP